MIYLSVCSSDSRTGHESAATTTSRGMRQKEREKDNKGRRESMWYPLSLTTTLRKATRVTFERQDDAMNYKMTVKAKVSSGFADTKEKERERKRYEVRCTAEPSNRPTSQPPPNLMKQRRVRLLTGEAPSKCLGKVAGCYMTCPRMWKCNVYTFNHVLSHRSPPRIRNYVRLSSPRLLSSFHVVALQRHQR